MAKVLLVDDDRALVALLESALSRHDVVFACDGAGALHQVDVEKPDLIMLDLRMPDLDGALLLPKIRQLTSAPVIVLSARHEQVDIVQALRAGADDVIAKPFDIYDLEARVEAVLRRSATVPTQADEFVVGQFVISDALQARINGVRVYLTPLEHKVVLQLARYAGMVVARKELVRLLWGDVGDTGNMLDQHVYRARKRLHGRPGAPTIATVRGFGYLMKTGVL